MLSLKNITAKIDKKLILDDISIAFRPGRIYAIMGPNGSGKSTLARVIMGDPAFTVSRKAQITLGAGKKQKKIKNMDPDERAAEGIFLSMQSPLAIPGVTAFGLLRAATKDTGESARDLKKRVDQYARELRIPEELLTRSLNDGFSGGERKKMEVLQMAILDPDYILLDEIDTGVDVDALKTIATFLKNHIKQTKKTLIIITHYNRILRYLSPDETVVIQNGQIAKRGDASLAKMIEKKGFEAVL